MSPSDRLYRADLEDRADATTEVMLLQRAGRAHGSCWRVNGIQPASDGPTTPTASAELRMNFAPGRLLAHRPSALRYRGRFQFFVVIGIDRARCRVSARPGPVAVVPLPGSGKSVSSRRISTGVESAIYARKSGASIPAN